MMNSMDALKARVKNGHLVIEGKTDLPEGTELYLVPVSEGEDRYLMKDDGLSDAQRSEITEMIEESFEDEAAGQETPFAEVIAQLHA